MGIFLELYQVHNFEILTSNQKHCTTLNFQLNNINRSSNQDKIVRQYIPLYMFYIYFFLNMKDFKTLFSVIIIISYYLEYGEGQKILSIKDFILKTNHTIIDYSQVIVFLKLISS